MITSTIDTQPMIPKLTRSYSAEISAPWRKYVHLQYSAQAQIHVALNIMFRKIQPAGCPTKSWPGPFPFY